MREGPLFQKCCHCIPLQYCLHAWVGFKVVVDITLAGILALLILILYGFDKHFLDEPKMSHFFIIIIIMLLVDCGFMIALGVGLCQKKVKVLKIFFCYNITTVILETFILTTMYILISWNAPYEIGVLFPIISFAYICLDICIALTTKSEMIKLRNKEQFEFIKMPSADGVGASENSSSCY